jgi:hypothetical protein
MLQVLVVIIIKEGSLDYGSQYKIKSQLNLLLAASVASHSVIFIKHAHLPFQIYLYLCPSFLFLTPCCKAVSL